MNISNSNSKRIIDDSSSADSINDTEASVSVYAYSEDYLPAGWKFTSTLAAASITTAGDLDLTEDYGEDIKKVDASKTKSGVEIYGNDLNNSIKGGRGADIICDGRGNDTVSLGGGADTYYYIGGDDFIQDYTTVDVIQFDTENISDITREISGKNVIFTTNAGTLTLKNASTKNITLLDSNGEDFSVNKKSVENLWFIEDNPDCCELDSITEQKFEVQNIQSADYNLEQNENILTFTNDK